MSEKPKRTAIVLRSRNLPDDPIAVLQQAAKEAGNWPAWRKLEQARIVEAEKFFAQEYNEPLKNAVANADKAAFAAMADNIKADVEMKRLRAENASLRSELEQTRVQLAGCSAAAMGYGGECKRGDFGWSASFGDVMKLREENARQAETIARLREAAQALVDFWNTPTEEQTKLTTVEADELTELECALREALKGSL